ncbi:MAG: TlyA family RNA methyltransferase [Victivallales bacterium]
MKIRADILLAEQGLCESREQAKRLILAGKVRAGADRVIQKASELFDSKTALSIEETSPYVSRGAYKLLPAVEKYLPDMKGLICLDVGASTGGFTDLMIQRGAERVYAVDVGTAQLHQKLRDDPRVISRENVNARYLDETFLPARVDVLTMDISFISVMKVLPATDKLLKPGGLAFILIKPQFEAGRKDVEKGGVVKDENVRARCVKEIADFMEKELSYSVVEVIPSPILGPKGNQEFMAVFKKSF